MKMDSHPSKKPSENSWVFLHIMKTAGTSFRSFIAKTCPRSYYPTPEDLKNNSRPHWYLGSEAFIDMINSREAPPEAKYIFGHYPFSIIDHLSHDFRVATVLREPLSRSISMIKHRKRANPQKTKDMSDLDLLRKTPLLKRQVKNYQTKVLGMDGLNVNLPVDSEEGLLERAIENITSLDFLGITERMEETVELWRELEPAFLNSTFPRENEAPKDIDIDENLLEYLTENLSLDLELYRHATREFDKRILEARKSKN